MGVNRSIDPRQVDKKNIALGRRTTQSVPFPFLLPGSRSLARSREALSEA